jgi:hypothetical protein
LSIALQAADAWFGCDQLLWISAFASPSLLAFRSIYVRDSDKSQVSHLATSVILKTIGERCPDVHSIAIYPNSEMGDTNSDGESCFLNMIWAGPFLQYLRPLVKLQEISTSLSLIDRDGLLVLGTLPQLVDLRIRGCSDYLEEPTLSIPDGSFPRLTSLALWEIHVAVLVDLMAIKPLASGLTSLSLSHWFEEEDGMEQVTWFETTFPQLLQHTPHLVFFASDATYNPTPFPIDLSLYWIWDTFLQRTSELNLEAIQLAGLNFASTATLGNMPAAWSKLTKLRLLHVVVAVDELPYFAKLPNLQWLALRLPLNDNLYGPWSSFDGHDTGLALRTLETTETELADGPPSDAIPVARYVTCSVSAT